MQRNIIIELMENFTPEFLSKAALTLKETESGVSRGFENLIPSILYQLNHQLDRSDANQFFQLLKKEKNISFMNQLDGLIKDDNLNINRKSITGGFIEKLFGGQQTDILGFVSQRNQIKTKSAQSLMTIAGALVMGYLSKMIRKDGLKLDSLKSFLLGQEDNIEAVLPVGMTNWLGNIRPLATAGTSSKSKGAAAVAYASTATATASGGAVAVSSASSATKYLWLLPLLLLLFLGGWYFLSPSSTISGKDSISQKENRIPPTTTSTSEQLEEVEDELVAATEEIALGNKIETTTANNTSTIDTPPASDNSISTGVEKMIKEELIAEVTISEPELIEEIDITAASSPGKIISSEDMYAKGNIGFNNTDTNTNDSYVGTSMSVDKPAPKVRYEDYIKKVKMPEQVGKAGSKIERKVSTVLPDWYTESKKVVNGNSSHVTVIKKTETILDGRNTTSDALSELRKSLSLTTYNAWFGHVVNPISSTEYRFYSYLSGKQKSSNQTDKYTWFTLDKVKFPKYASKMDFDVSKGQLGRIANILSANPDVTLRIGGFTSDLGKKKVNRKLSLEMAEQTKAALVKLGVAENRIDVKGYGESNPIGLNDTELGRMRNHRVGFRVMSR